MLKLYTAQVCPFAHRCRLALAFGNIEHERVEIDLKAMPDWYRAISPNQKVPLLEVGNSKVWESAIINEYLAEAFPQAGLLPQSALDRSRARLASDFFGNRVIPVFYSVLREPESDAAQRLQQAFQEAPEWMDPQGPFWVGSTPSLADANIYPWFERLGPLAHYRGFTAQLPARLQTWLDAMRSHPAVQAEAGDEEDYIAGYKRYAQSSK